MLDFLTKVRLRLPLQGLLTYPLIGRNLSPLTVNPTSMISIVHQIAGHLFKEIGALLQQPITLTVFQVRPVQAVIPVFMATLPIPQV
jgi:hypothetical protein